MDTTSAMSFPVRAAFVGMALTLFGAHAQSASSANQDEGKQGFTLHQTVEEVLLYCTVVDRKGHLVTDLDRADFRVQEDKRSVSIGHFTRQDTPVSLSLVLDDSDSMKDKRAALQSGALDLIKLSNPSDEVSLTNFADEAYIDQDLTTDLGTVQHALTSSNSVSGGTALFDTLISASDHLSARAHNSKRVIVVMTDGKDNASGADLRAAIQRVQSADGPVIYAIGLLYDLTGPDARRARKELSELADDTGGIAFFPRAATEIQQTAAQVAADIRSQYMIAFRPLPDSSGGNAYHTVAVHAAAPAHGSLQVRTRKGFFRHPGNAAP